MDLLKSKKFQMALAGIVVVIVTSFIPEIDEGELTKIVAIVLGYLFSQGLADFGKEGKNR